jgi:hypothetical protein
MIVAFSGLTFTDCGKLQAGSIGQAVANAIAAATQLTTGETDRPASGVNGLEQRKNQMS